MKTLKPINEIFNNSIKQQIINDSIKKTLHTIQIRIESRVFEKIREKRTKLIENVLRELTPLIEDIFKSETFSEELNQILEHSISEIMNKQTENIKNRIASAFYND